jgi:hypothetical protein
MLVIYQKKKLFTSYIKGGGKKITHQLKKIPVITKAEEDGA